MSIKSVITINYPKDGQWFDGRAEDGGEDHQNIGKTNKSLSNLRLISIVGAVALVVSVGSLPFILA